MYCDGLRIDDIRAQADASPFYLYSKEKIRWGPLVLVLWKKHLFDSFFGAAGCVACWAACSQGMCKDACMRVRSLAIRCRCPEGRLLPGLPAACSLLPVLSPPLCPYSFGAGAHRLLTLTAVPNRWLLAVSCTQRCSIFAPAACPGAGRTTRRMPTRFRGWTPSSATLSRPTTTSRSCRCDHHVLIACFS